MADLEETLNSLLSDPNAMGQIMDLAGKLGLGGGGETEPEAEPEPEPGQDAPPPDQDAFSALGPLLSDPSQLLKMGKLLEVLQSGSQLSGEATALLTALRPFLRADRQRKLDRAMRLAGLSQAARQAYRLWKEGELHL